MVSSTPRPHFTPGKHPVPILQEAGWAAGPVWTGKKTRPHRDSIPDRPARSSVGIATIYIYIHIYMQVFAIAQSNRLCSERNTRKFYSRFYSALNQVVFYFFHTANLSVWVGSFL